MSRGADGRRLGNNTLTAPGQSYEMRVAATRRAARANAKRIPCTQCAMLILPADMVRHVAIHHSED